MADTDLPKTRAEAIQRGEKKYFTGKPCKHGHTSIRRLPGNCVVCETAMQKSAEYRRYQSEYRKRNPPKKAKPRPYFHADLLKKVYGLSAERYAAMLAEQKGVCAICGNGCATGKPLAVDHNHACCPTQKSCGSCIRGLLCAKCNTMLGFAKDSAALLMAAAKYLGRWAR